MQLHHCKRACPLTAGRYQLTWDNTEELQQYTLLLQAEAQAFSSRNRSLRKSHFSFTDTVLELFGTDLLRAAPRWAEELLQMRTHCAGLVAQQIPQAAVNAWALHWDHQLYKGTCISVTSNCCFARWGPLFSRQHWSTSTRWGSRASTRC